MGMLEKLKTPTKIVLSFIFGILCGKLLITQYEAVTFKPWVWNKPPVVLNCYGPMLRPAYIEKSVQYWEDLGEKVLFIEYVPIRKLCKNRHKITPGFIKIYQGSDISFNSESTLAFTKRKASTTTGILGANIIIRPGTYTIKNLLTHEFGHAFGYTHVEETGHIMHPVTEKMGDKFWIP
jgi:hypothetical protein